MKTLLIIILVILLVRMLVRMFLPMILKSLVEKASRDLFNMQNQYTPPRPEGEVKINSTNNVRKSVVDEGEYIDYEEIK